MLRAEKEKEKMVKNLNVVCVVKDSTTEVQQSNIVRRKKRKKNKKMNESNPPAYSKTSMILSKNNKL